MKRSYTKNVLAVLFGVILAVIVCEGSLRTYQWLAKGIPFFSFLPGYRPTRFPLSPFLVFGPRVNWQIPGKQHPEFAYFNSQGFRTREVLGKKPFGQLRIIALGGSTTEGVWNEAGYHWPLVLEQELHAAGCSNVRVYNGAMSAYTTAHTLVRFEFDVLQYEPDFLIVMHNINDLLVNYAAAVLGRPVDPNYHVKYGQKDYTGNIDDTDVVLLRTWHSIRVRLLDWFGREDQNRPVNYELTMGLQAFKRNLINIDAVARNNRCKLVLLTMPVARSMEEFDLTLGIGIHGRLDVFPDYESFIKDFDTYNAAIREVGRDYGIAVVDMSQLSPPDDRYFADIVHYTTEGEILFGKILAQEILHQLAPCKRLADESN